MMVYAPDDDKYYAQDKVPSGKKVLKLSGTEVIRRLQTGEDIPEWSHIKSHSPKLKHCITLLFTDLSGSGKSTIANALRENYNVRW